MEPLLKNIWKLQQIQNAAAQAAYKYWEYLRTAMLQLYSSRGMYTLIVQGSD